ncbi:hypothetical protein HDU98_012332, partial [Podochytrium sp. JEL0797]
MIPREAPKSPQTRRLPSSPITRLSCAFTSMSEGVVDSAKGLLLLGSPALSETSPSREFKIQSGSFSHHKTPTQPGDAEKSAAGSRNASPHVQVTSSEDLSAFSCKINYATHFSHLRRSCGISDTAFIDSLSRCVPWKASGGKTKFAFFKTQDDKYIVKQLASTWSVLETDAMLAFSPGYFEHMKAPAPTSLAAIVGFFSITRKNLETGVFVQLDVLVSENLFAGMGAELDSVFDLKGVMERTRSPNHTANSSTGPTGNTSSNNKKKNSVLWDADWVRLNNRLGAPVDAVPKRVFMDAVKRDLEFLAKSN